MRTPCFTLNYAAPEVLEQVISPNADGYAESCDLWSLGVILYAMLSGRAPFQLPSREASAPAILKRIQEGEFSFRGSQWSRVSNDAKDVIRGLLTIDPMKRLTLNLLIEHQWVQEQILRGNFSFLHAVFPLVSRSYVLFLTFLLSFRCSPRKRFTTFWCNRCLSACCVLVSSSRGIGDAPSTAAAAHCPSGNCFFPSQGDSSTGPQLTAILHK